MDRELCEIVYYVCVASLVTYALAVGIEACKWKEEKAHKTAKAFFAFYKQVGMPPENVDRSYRSRKNREVRGVAYGIVAMMASFFLTTSTVYLATYPVLILLMAATIPVGMRFDQHIKDWAGVNAAKEAYDKGWLDPLDKPIINKLKEINGGEAGKAAETE